MAKERQIRNRKLRIAAETLLRTADLLPFERTFTFGVVRHFWWRMIFSEKPVPTPDRVRGMLFGIMR